MEVQLQTHFPSVMEVETQDSIDHTISWSSIHGSIIKLLTLSDDAYIPSDTIAMEIYKCFMEDEPSGSDAASAFLRKYKETVESYIFLKFFPVRYHKDQMLGFCEFLTEWKAFKKFFHRLSNAFNYLDRFYHMKHNLQQLHQVAMECFDQLVFQEVKQFLKSIILDQIRRHREGEEIDISQLRYAIDVFVDVYMETHDKFEKELEAEILKRADNFYLQKLDRLANIDITMSDEKERSLSIVLQALARDKRLAGMCMPETSKQKLVKKVDDVLHSIHPQTDTASDSLLEEDNP